MENLRGWGTSTGATRLNIGEVSKGWGRETGSKWAGNRKGLLWVVRGQANQGEIQFHRG